MKLSREIKKLRIAVNKKREEVYSWKRKYKKIANTKKLENCRLELKKTKLKLEKSTKYCEKIFSKIKMNISEIKNQKIKRKIVECLNLGIKKAPSKKLSLNFRYYNWTIIHVQKCKKNEKFKERIYEVFFERL